MTLVDTDDLRARTCRQCGAVVWDRVTHQRWHHDWDAIAAGVEAAHGALLRELKGEPDARDGD